MWFFKNFQVWFLSHSWKISNFPFWTFSLISQLILNTVYQLLVVANLSGLTMIYFLSLFCGLGRWYIKCYCLGSFIRMYSKIIWARRFKYPHSTVPWVILLSVGALGFCFMWQNSNRLEQVSIQDSLRVESQWSKSSSFKILSGPLLKKVQNVSSSTFFWSTQITRPA